MVAQVGYSVARRLGGWVMLCTVCTLHVEMRSVGFLVEPQNQGRWFIGGLTSKQLGRFLPVWPQNRWRRFLLVWSENRWWVSWLSIKTKVATGFKVCASKLTAMIWWFDAQNHHNGFLVCVSKPSGLRFVGYVTKPIEDRVGARHASRSSSLLRLEECRARVFQFASKLAEMWRRVVYVAPSRRSRDNQVEDGWIDAMGYVGPFYPKSSFFY
jgi:hypothetical protein